jgi:sucrose-6-phosphate hydrolase SacC (GH32 family)
MWFLGASPMLALLGLTFLGGVDTTDVGHPGAGEALRPQFHFTTPSGWINDPNGLVFADGVYHMFYQHNPFGTQWGNMTWGHATSKDLIHWDNHPEAIEPDALGTIFSGSAVVDVHDTAGFGKNALVCIYTAAGGTNDASKGKPFTQCLAYSHDGKTFTKFAGNPVLENLSDGNRDPKVVWHAPTQKWVLALYLRGGTYGLFGSKDLKVWSKLSEVDMPGTDECPDFFEIPLDGRAGHAKWVFSGANGNYRVGSFDGQTFHAETPVIRSHFGNTGYAGQTYSRTADGRRIQIEWMQGAEFPNSAWNQQMTFPNELTLVTTPEGSRLSFAPIRELASIHSTELKPMGDLGNTQALHEPLYVAPSGLFDVSLDYKVPATGVLTVRVNGVDVVFDAATKKLSALGKEAALDTRGGKLNLRILADRTSVEIYAQGGLVWMPLFALPQADAGHVVKISRGPGFEGKVTVFELKPQ